MVFKCSMLLQRRYSDLKRELKKIPDMSVKLIAIVAGALGATPKK